ncbi:hypothetical protein P7K49_020635 [Saguinus oedipus]|uniref:Uncharacterized protein n=1 Tax=Saguinus oedipus TaxID=9490 RepID=A0ABQ9V2N8_SAGOE|nr:hypothetical protein P7K49_020635 [Saguinus oedipus]
MRLQVLWAACASPEALGQRPLAFGSPPGTATPLHCAAHPTETSRHVRQGPRRKCPQAPHVEQEEKPEHKQQERPSRDQPHKPRHSHTWNTTRGGMSFLGFGFVSVVKEVALYAEMKSPRAPLQFRTMPGA